MGDSAFLLYIAISNDTAGLRVCFTSSPQPACVARCTPSPKVPSFLPSFASLTLEPWNAVLAGWLADSTLHCSPDACEKPADERRHRYSSPARHARQRRCPTLQLWCTTVVHLSRKANSHTRRSQSSGLLVSIPRPLAGPRISIVWTVY
jgi:hypothetical protein